MEPLTILTLTVGTAIAKAIVSDWLNDHTFLLQITSDFLDLFRDTIKSETDRQHATEQIEKIGQQIASQVRLRLEQEYASREYLNPEAVIREVVLTLQQAEITADLIIQKRVSSQRFADYLIESRIEVLKSFSADETHIYKHLLTSVSKEIVIIADELAGFTPLAFASTLEGQRIILNNLSALLTRSSEEMIRYEKKYRNFIGKTLDNLEMFGISYADEIAERQSLSIVYISLHVELRHLRSVVGKTALSSDLQDDPIEASVQIVEQLLAQHRRIVLRGDAGSGKTTLLKWIVVQAANQTFPPELSGWHNVVPFLIVLRKRVGKNFPLPEEFPLLEANTISGDMPQGWVNRILENGRALILVDGVDELPREQRKEMLFELKKLINAYPLARYIISSRPYALKEDIWPEWEMWTEKENFVTASLQPMSSVQIEKLIDQWHAALAKAHGNSTDALTESANNLKQIIRQRPLRKLAESPLLCAMLCALHRVQGDALSTIERIRLYRDCVEMLLERRDITRKVKADYSDLALDYNEKLNLIRQFAYWMMSNKESTVGISETDSFFNDYLSTTTRENFSGTKIRRYFVERTNLLREPSIGSIEFTHRTFEEFLAAQAIYARKETGRLVNYHISHPEWRETIILFSGYVGTVSESDRTKFLKRLINKGRRYKGKRYRHKAFSLAVACLEGKAGLEKTAQDYVLKYTASIFPPNDEEEAKTVSTAGDPAISLLRANQKHSEKEAAMCVRALGFISSPAALEALIDFTSDERRTVQVEIGRAWDSFDRQVYIWRILSRCQSLYLQDNPNLGGFDKLTHLKNLAINSSDQVLDLSALSSLINLSKLDIRGTVVNNLGPLRSLSQLTILLMGEERLTSSSYIGYRYDRMPIIDLNPLSSLPQLTTLDIIGVRVSSLEPLGQLDNLTKLNISFANVTIENSTMGIMYDDDLPDWLQDVEEQEATANITYVTCEDLLDWLRDVVEQEEECVAEEIDAIQAGMLDLERLLAEEGIDLALIEEEIPEGAIGMSARHWMILTSDDELIWRWIGDKEGVFSSVNLINTTIKVIKNHRKLSISQLEKQLQQQLRIGYAQAAHLINELQRRVIINPNPGDGNARTVFASEKRDTEASDSERLFEMAREIVLADGKASVSQLQRKLRIGYARAARLIDELESQEIISPDIGDGSARIVFASEKGDAEVSDSERLFEMAREIVLADGKASVSQLQRKLKIGYARAARLIDELESQEIISPDIGDGSARIVFASEKGDAEVSDSERLFEMAREIVLVDGKASVSQLQRKLKIGYARAARLIDELESQRIIGPDPGGGRARKVQGDKFNFLTSLTQLASLDLSETQIYDLSPLLNLSKLTFLNISNTDTHDITPLSDLSLLSILNISKTKVADFEPLASLTNLTRLDISATSISDLGPLANLSQLSMLDISNSSVIDLSPLTRLSQLLELYIGHTQVKDLSPLAQLTHLSKIDISGTKIDDLKPLNLLPNLTELNVTGTQISDSSYDLLRNMKKLNVIGTPSTI